MWEKDWDGVIQQIYVRHWLWLFIQTVTLFLKQFDDFYKHQTNQGGDLRTLKFKYLPTNFGRRYYPMVALSLKKL